MVLAIFKFYFLAIKDFLDFFNFYTHLGTKLEAFLPLECRIHHALVHGHYEVANDYLEQNSENNANLVFEIIAVNSLLHYSAVSFVIY